MALTVTPLENVGIEVGGFDITRPIDGDLRRELIDLFDEHAVLLFRGQDVTPANQIEFSRIFGPLATHPLAETTSLEHPELFTLVNDPDKEKSLVNYWHGRPLVGRLAWHMDLHYTGRPNRGAVLRSVDCAPGAGGTGFGDLATAFDALDADTQALLGRIEVAYCFSMQRRHMRYADLEGYEPGPHAPKKPTDMGYPNFPDVAYPAVVTHPVTGRRVLEVTEQFLDRIVAPHHAGLCNDEAIELLEHLVAHTRRADFHYMHEWRDGDMVLWDNWRAMHCATGTPPGIRRLIHRTTIDGDTALGRVLDAC